MRLRLRASASVACALLGFAVMPAGAAPASSQTWSLSAAGNADATVRISKPLTLQLDESINDLVAERAPIDGIVTKAGLYGGAIIRDRRGDVRAALVRFAKDEAIVVWGSHDDQNRQVLEPGTYRITVLGDRETKVGLRVAGTAPRPVRATARATVRAAYSTDASSLDGQLPVASFVQDLKVGPKTTWAAIGAFTGPLAGVDVYDMCVADPDGVECLNAPAWNPGNGGAVGSERGYYTALFGYPSFGVAPGQYEVRLREVSAGLSTAHGLFTIASD